MSPSHYDFILLSLVGLVTADPCSFPQFAREHTIEDGQFDSLFATFKHCYAKEYGNAEVETVRQAAFAANMQFIMQKNAENELAGTSMRLGVNEFADLTLAEFSEAYLMRSDLPPSPLHPRSAQAPRAKPTPNRAALGANEIMRGNGCDWTYMATPVKNQGQCGSCYIFAVIAAAEGAVSLAATPDERPVALSEQQVGSRTRLQYTRACAHACVPARKGTRTYANTHANTHENTHTRALTQRNTVPNRF
jgi:hypothetical protein